MDETAMAAPAIEIRDLVVRFGDTTAVDGVSLDVPRGELLMLLGGSGSGKTTTLKCINRLIEPAAGVIRVNGRDVRERVAHELRRDIGYCFQRIGLFPHMTVAENVGVTPKLLGWPRDRVDARVRELLAMVELSADALWDRMPRALSGGQQQRVGVARALCVEPKVVLFDEPFGALDPITREQLQASFATLRARLGLTGIFVTHDVVEAFALGDRIAVMRDGRVLQIDTPQQLRAAPADDYVRQLVEAPERAARLSSARFGAVDG